MTGACNRSSTANIVVRIASPIGDLTRGYAPGASALDSFSRRCLSRTPPQTARAVSIYLQNAMRARQCLSKSEQQLRYFRRVPRHAFEAVRAIAVVLEARRARRCSLGFQHPDYLRRVRSTLRTLAKIEPGELLRLWWQKAARRMRDRG